jgi:hypothetical protein
MSVSIFAAFFGHDTQVAASGARLLRQLGEYFRQFGLAGREHVYDLRTLVEACHEAHAAGQRLEQLAKPRRRLQQAHEITRLQAEFLRERCSGVAGGHGDLERLLCRRQFDHLCQRAVERRGELLRLVEHHEVTRR